MARPFDNHLSRVSREKTEQRILENDEMNLLPLLPKHGILFVAYGMRGGRFAEAFRATWGTIPEENRQRILAHWNRLVHSPSISYRDDALASGVVAAGAVGGHVITFAASKVDAMPDEVLATLIARELAHVDAQACGVTVGESSVSEVETHERMAAWGYNAQLIREWCYGNT